MKKKTFRKLSLKKSLQNTKAIITAEMPSYLSGRYYGQVASGIIMIFLGISIAIITRSTAIAAFPVFAGICLIVMGIIYKKTVLGGYDIITGTIIDYKKFIPGNNVADGYVIQTETEQISIPTKKRKNALPIGTALRVYIAVNTDSYSKDGKRIYGNVLGYDVVYDDVAQ